MLDDDVGEPGLDSAVSYVSDDYENVNVPMTSIGAFMGDDTGAQRASGFGVGSATLCSVCRSVWWNGSS